MFSEIIRYLFDIYIRSVESFYGVEWRSFSFICIQQVSGTIISSTSSVQADVWVWKLPTGSIYYFVIIFSHLVVFGALSV